VQSYGEEGLRASIAEQLHWLLNTRVPIDYPTLDARTRQGLRSTVDYGLPDLSAYPVGEPDARARLHEHLAQTIALYEPRLLRPSVSLSPSDGRSDTLVAEVAGTIRIGLIETPVTFRFDIDTEKRAGHGG
jgi:type VI secretion system lysozyme-like protein